MSARHSSCQPNAIEKYLSQRLSDAEQATVETHLDSCSGCRARMEALAADPDFWSTACSVLGTVANDGAVAQVGRHSSANVKRADNIQHILRTILTASDDPSMLGRIGGYEVSAVIGYGAMGIVLKASDRRLDRVVAIKVMAPSLSAQGSARQRFEREARAAAAVLHPNVIAIHGISEWNEVPYLVMPYIGGESLQQRIDRTGPLAVPEILRVGHQIAAGLQAAHAQGLIHRDIKPSNILLEAGKDRLQITDFGLARAADDASLTQSGLIAGTPQFMSPEQARGETIDQRSDLFSLGSVMFATCTGQPPFRAETAFGVLRRITDDEASAIHESNPNVPDWLCRLIAKLLCKHADERYQSAQEVAGMFESCIAHVTQPEENPIPFSLLDSGRPGSDGLRTWKRISVVAAIACVLIATGVLTLSPKKLHILHEARFVTEEQQAIGGYRYAFRSDEDVSYLVTLHASGTQADTHMEGLLMLHADSVGPGRFRLIAKSDLTFAEQKRIEKEYESASFQRTSRRSFNTNGPVMSSLIVTDTGAVVSRSGGLDLPYGLGSLPELVIHRLPGFHTSEWTFQRHVNAFVGSSQRTPSRLLRGSSNDGKLNVANRLVSATGNSVVINGDLSLLPPEIEQEKADRQFSGTCEIIFDPQAGLVSSAVLQQTWVRTVNGVEESIPVQVEVVRITNEEQREWEESHGRHTSILVNDRESSAAERQQDSLIADLTDEDRIMCGLRALESRPPQSYPQKVIHALVPLLKHGNPSYRSRAKRLVEQIPEEQLNPFQVID